MRGISLVFGRAFSGIFDWGKRGRSPIYNTKGRQKRGKKGQKKNTPRMNEKRQAEKGAKGQKRGKKGQKNGQKWQKRAGNMNKYTYL